MDFNRIVCKRINNLFMKHMDGLTNKAERDEMMSHINECVICREDFEVYETIRVTLEENGQLCQAPEGFEASVMQKIANLPAKTPHVMNIAYVILSSLIISLGALVTIFVEDIASALAQSADFSVYIVALEGSLQTIILFISNIGTYLSGIAVLAFEMIAQVQLVILLIFVLLIMLQFLVYKYDKA